MIIQIICKSFELQGKEQLFLIGSFHP